MVSGAYRYCPHWHGVGDDKKLVENWMYLCTACGSTWLKGLMPIAPVIGLALAGLLEE